MLVNKLIEFYQTDAASSYGKLRYRTRLHYDGLLRRVEADLGERDIGGIKTRDLILTHQAWMLRGVPMSHALIVMLRTLCGYGATILEDDDCLRLSGRMHAMRFQMGKPRVSRLTAAQVIAIRKKAREIGLYSIALCQSFQFDLMLRQRDCLGEWVPLSEPGDSDVHSEGMKWLRGLRWEEVDSDRILRHVTSKRQKEIEVDLNLAKMVLEEMEGSEWPKNGPVVVSEATGLPYRAWEFRRLWRSVASSVGVPDCVYNMDTRSGAITEATDAGASLDLVRHAATHSDVATTARYSRGSADKIAEVMRLRAQSREASNG